MDVDRFFVDTLDDLQSRATWDASEYALLRASALLRELLVDPKPLVEQANREHRLRLRYQVRTPPSTPGLLFWLGIDPEEPADGGPIKSLTVSQLLAQNLVFSASMAFSVRDLITYGANVLGGVHHGDASSDVHRALRDAPLKIEHGGRPLGLVAMVPIAHVVLSGVRPLSDAIRAGLPPARPFDGRVSVTCV